MKIITVSIILMLLGACSSTGVIPMGENLYSISKTSFGCDLVGAGGVKSDIYIEMNKFCNGKKLYPEVATIEALDGVAGSRCASATIEFRCVYKSDVDLEKPTGEKPDRDMNRNAFVPSDRGQFGNKNPGKIKIKQDIRVMNTDDIYADLKKLKNLLDSGAINQKEFEALKAKRLAE